MTNLVIQSFGNETEYRRAIFAILSFVAHSRTENDQRKILVFTDNEEFFKKFVPFQFLIFIHLSENKIREMRGKSDFLHRMKIAIIENAFQQLDDNLIYADSDSFFTGNPSILYQSLSPEHSFMHRHEYEFRELQTLPLPSGEPFIRFYNNIISQSFQLHDNSNIVINPEMSSWNAGVMMLHKDHKNLLPDVYALTDQFYVLTKNHACEQFAFSIILKSKTNISPCESVNYHYWQRIEKQIADLLFMKVFDDRFARLSEDHKIQKIIHLTRILPQYINRHKLMFRDRAIQAFNNNDFRSGYINSFRAIIKDPFTLKFIRDILYHTKRFIFSK